MSARQEDRLLNSFRNILCMEQAKGFTNEVVINGLDAFIAQCRPQLSAHFPKTADASKLLDRPYSPMTPAQRARWVETCLALLDFPNDRPQSTKPKSATAPASRRRSSFAKTLPAQATAAARPGSPPQARHQPQGRRCQNRRKAGPA